MSDALRVFRARHVATMLSPLLDDGCVIVRGDRIVDVGPTHLLRPPRVDVEVDGVLMPGLINAHTHLELTNVARPTQSGRFVDWLLATMASQRRDSPDAYMRDRAEGVRQGIAQCLKFGVTCVGDISQNVDIVRPILADSLIRAVSFGECLGIGPRRRRFEALLEKAIHVEPSARQTKLLSQVRIGVSPHSPYTVDEAGFVQIAEAQAAGALVTTHLAETPDEDRFINDHGGAFGELYAALGIDPGPASHDAAGVIGAFHRRRQYGWLLAHVNYCTFAEMNQLAERRASVVWCPRTHRYFGHPPHRWKEMIRRDINVCVGTDSCASSPDLNIVDDLRLLHQDEPDVPVEALWAMVTRDAERALRWGWYGAVASGIASRPLGVIAPGAMADFVTFPTRSVDPLRGILETGEMLPSGIWIGGEAVSSDSSPCAGG
jgi:cytosine/adenosine deaminase-related metal-dependent hydrolase